MRTFALIAAVLVVGALAQNDCAQYTDCQDCVTHQLCGWCSEPVIYANNKTGTQCAGFNPHGRDPFECNGIFSTDQCVAGYVCNNITYQCELGQQGQGTSKKQCEANCYNHGHVYLCNKTTHECYKVPPGTKGASSYGVCQAECSHPSPHPAPPPSPHPTNLYTCNYTTGQCVTAPAGKGESKEVCEQSCHKQANNKYMCNTFLQKCFELPPGTHGLDKAECEEECTPHPKPGPPPSIVQGMYRGIGIQNDYQTGEYDMKLNETTFELLFTDGTGKMSYVTGTPYYIKESNQNAMWVKLTSGPNIGKYWKSISRVSGQSGPETDFMTSAFGVVGDDAPSSFKSAMTTEGQVVMALTRCHHSAPECVFAMPTVRGPQSRGMAAQSLKSAMAAVFDHFDPVEAITDHCTKYNKDCSECISHKLCGWCSVDVVYKGGIKGTQCAGFSPNGTEPFTCSGRYSTLNCTNGYTCDQKNFQCVPTSPGNGLPKAECEELCHPTPPPTPPQALYTCNTTTKQCIKCDKHYCPGALPLGPCEASCVHPKHGPHGEIIGTWRGINIQNGYPLGEVDYVFNKTSVKVYNRGTYNYTASIVSLGADLMIYTVTDGNGVGNKFGNIYQLATGIDSGLYTAMTIGQGAPNQQTPQSFADAMETPGMLEQVVFKCSEEPCKFNSP